MISPLFESVPPRLYGGTERVVYNLCRGLTEADVQVTLFASGDSSAEGRLIPMIDEALRLKSPPSIDPNAYNLRMLSEVARRAGEFDVIHNHHDYWMLPLTQMVDTPQLTTIHGRLDFSEALLAFGGFPLSNLVSISNSQRAPMSAARWLRTIYHGIECEDFEFYEKPGKYLAFLGRISAEKRPEWAIAMAKKSGIPLKIAAKIEGSSGQAYYDHFIKPHVDGNNVEYVGEISEREKSEFLGNALALAFPIDWPEPFGLVVMESLVCGTPVLARPCGSMPELLQDGVTGYMNMDIEKLAEHVGDIGKISRRGCRQWVEQRFSLKRMTEDYINVYRHLTEFRSHADRYRRNIVYPVERSS